MFFLTGTVMFWDFCEFNRRLCRKTLTSQGNWFDAFPPFNPRDNPVESTWPTIAVPQGVQMKPPQMRKFLSKAKSEPSYLPTQSSFTVLTRVSRNVGQLGLVWLLTGIKPPIQCLPWSSRIWHLKTMTGF